MTTVSDIMTREVRALAPTDSVRRAAQSMGELNVGSVPVCNGKKLVGMVTDRDIVIRGVARDRDGKTRLADVMSANVRCATDNEDLDLVLKSMAEAQIRRMPVVDGSQKLVGIVSIGDIAAKDRNNDADVAESLGDISSPAAPERSTGKR